MVVLVVVCLCQLLCGCVSCCVFVLVVWLCQLLCGCVSCCVCVSVVVWLLSEAVCVLLSVIRTRRSSKSVNRSISERNTITNRRGFHPRTGSRSSPPACRRP